MLLATSGTVTSDKWNNLVNFCDKQLKLISKCLTTFDYKSLMDKGVTLEILWNATNLFLKPGMYFDQPFPPIIGLEFSNLVLDRNFEPYELGFKI